MTLNETAVLAACRAHAPQFDRMDPTIQKYALVQMQDAISAYLSSIGGIVCAREPAEWQGRYWMDDEQRWSNWITNPSGYSWAYTPQEGKYEIRDLHAPLSVAGKGEDRDPSKSNQVVSQNIEAMQDKIDGLEADLESAVEVAYRRGATDWVRLNYPANYARLSSAPPSLQFDTEGAV
ncbi:hypothetical protein [Rhizobium rhizogenes]|uniref:hypothetical protein n=1 Tax=Rhizobium rhizogenes TaxID=359 RepID=UPI0022711100|nr:hypothetical protein [Rhizobium rhizogenes]